MTRLRLACMLALLIPVCSATGVMLFVAFGERVGAAPFGGLAPQNSAEAAGWGRAGDVLRFLRSGEDLRQVYDVRPEFISSAVRRATALEASMWSRQIELVRLLDQLAPFNEKERAALACLAADLKIDEVVEYLAPDGIGHCESGNALERVLARSRPS